MERNHSFLTYAPIIGTTVILFIGIIVIVINFFSGIVGGIWLGIFGHWKSIVSGIVIAIAMPWLYILVSLPSLGLTVLAGFLAEKGMKTLTALVGFITSLYDNALIGIWVIMIFGYFMRTAEPKLHIPYLLWAYSTMMAPLSYMASKDSRDDSMGSALGIVFAQLSYLACVLFFYDILFFPLLYVVIALGVIFSLFTTIVVIVQIIRIEKTEKLWDEYVNAADEIDRDRSDAKKPSDNKILIVTDEELTLELLVKSLEKNLPQVEVFDTARNGKEALEKVDNEFYAAIVSSVIMPGMNGIEFYNLAMQNDSDIKERILFISGYDGEEVSSFINNNNLRWLKQPFNIDGLTSVISDIINNQDK